MLYTRAHARTADPTLQAVLWDDVFVLENGTRMREPSDPAPGAAPGAVPGAGRRVRRTRTSSITREHVADALTPLDRVRTQLQTSGVRVRSPGTLPQSASLH